MPSLSVLARESKSATYKNLGFDCFPGFIHVVNLIRMGNEIVGEVSDPPRPSELIYLMLEVLFKRIFYGAFLPA